MRRRFVPVLAAALLVAPAVPGIAHADPAYPFRDPRLPLPALPAPIPEVSSHFVIHVCRCR